MKIKYRGFTAKVFFSARTDTFCGEVLNSTDVIVFLASCPTEAVLLMHQIIDNYLSESPHKPVAQLKFEINMPTKVQTEEP